MSLSLRIEKLRDKAQVLLLEDGGGSPEDWDRILFELGTTAQLVEGDAKLERAVAVTIIKCEELRKEASCKIEGAKHAASR
jgi:hypothetical protein